MMQKVSFKEKFRQAFSFFKWDLKACTGIMTIYGILAAVFTIITFTLCTVIGSTGEASQIFSMLDCSYDTTIQIFQYISTSIIYLLTTIFTIIYTIKVFSYLHNKRKADLYGSLPIGRSTLYITKAACAYIFSIVPSSFFIGIISIISICFGQPVITEVTDIYVKIIMGALACISAYGFISVCCGTTVNSVVMFITVCIVYPLSAIFIKSIISSFFSGSFIGIYKDHFIMNALNPLAAYDGINIIYWLIFSAVCIISAAFLVKKRKAERAQTSFAYYLPCHIIKVLIAFLFGMFLGVLFGSLNVLGGFFGFVFGFILGSVPAFIIAHLIFYKRFAHLLKTSISLGCLVIAVTAFMALCNYDVFGYNSFIPPDDIKGAGLYCGNYVYLNKNDNIKKMINNMADDFSDEESIKKIKNLYMQYNRSITKTSQDKFCNVWVNILADNLSFFNRQPEYGFSFRLSNGKIVQRIYSYQDKLSISSRYSIYDAIDLDCCEITSSKIYTEKYSIATKADDNDFSITVSGNKKSEEGFCQKTLQNGKKSNVASQLREAFLKDLSENEKDYETVIYAQKHYEYEDDIYKYRYTLEDITNAKVVCIMSFDTNFYDEYTDIFLSAIIDNSNYNSKNSETYLIPESFKNTIKVLKDNDIMNDDGTINGADYFDYNVVYDYEVS